MSWDGYSHPKYLLTVNRCSLIVAPKTSRSGCVSNWDRGNYMRLKLDYTELKRIMKTSHLRTTSV